MLVDDDFVFSPQGMDCKAQGRAAHPVVGSTQTHFFPEGDASMNLRRESANVILRVDRTLLGYKHLMALVHRVAQRNPVLCNPTPAG